MTSGPDVHRPGERAARGTGVATPGVFPPGPSPDHPAAPLSRRWQIAGAVIGITIAAVAVSIALAEREPGPDYRTVEPTELAVTAGDTPSIDRVRVQTDPADPAAARVRVDGDDIVVVEVVGTALCDPLSGAPGAWIDVRLCGPLDTLTVTASDIDDEVTTALARF